MKKIISILLLAGYALAFDIGVYKCGDINAYYKFTLNSNGTARSGLFVYPHTLIQVQRGYWKNNDDYAEVITKGIFIEKRDGKFFYKGLTPCKKIK